MRWSHQKALHDTRIGRRFEEIHRAWDKFRANRARDAVYGYLSTVFETVMHYKVRRKTKKLLRNALKVVDLSFDGNADPFAAVIRCTSDDSVDSKTISKWARALRYVAWRKDRGTPLERFMKEAGGVNACADNTLNMSEGAPSEKCFGSSPSPQPQTCRSLGQAI